MHIGQLIKQELANQGRTVVWFAKQLSCSRAYTYKIFNQPSIETDRLLLISNLLGVDFFKVYSAELKETQKLMDINDDL